MGFLYEDYLYSETAEQHGIDNTPSAIERENITKILMPMCDMIYDLAEKEWPGCMSQKIKGGSLHSGFRGPRLNAEVGGSSTSAHCDGLGADIYPMNGAVDGLFLLIQGHPEIMRNIDQLILERGCVHVGMCQSGTPRNEIRGEKYIVKSDGKSVRTYPLLRVWKEQDNA